MKFTEGIKIELDPCTCKICTECRIRELLNARDQWKEQCEKLFAGLKWAEPRAPRGIDHGCHICTGITEIADGNYVCPMHKAQQALADHERMKKESE